MIEGWRLWTAEWIILKAGQFSRLPLVKLTILVIIFQNQSWSKSSGHQARSCYYFGLGTKWFYRLSTSGDSVLWRNAESGVFPSILINILMQCLFCLFHIQEYFCTIAYFKEFRWQSCAGRQRGDCRRGNLLMITFIVNFGVWICN